MSLVFKKFRSLFSDDYWEQGRLLPCTDIVMNNDVFTAKIRDESRTETVRIKVNRSSQSLQWKECSCLVYRRKGVACQHLSAFFQNLFFEPQFLDYLGISEYYSETPKEEIAPLTLVHSSFKAKRFFYVEKQSQDSIHILQGVTIEDESGKILAKKYLDSENYTVTFSLLEGYAKEPIGFNDEMTPEQWEKWNNLSSSMILSQDMAAQLVYDDFKSLRNIAHVEVHGEFNFIESTSPHVDFTALEHGLLLESSSLQEVLRARILGREFIPSEDGWIKITKEFDWLIPKNPALVKEETSEIMISKLEGLRLQSQLGQKIEFHLSDPLPEHPIPLRSYQEEGFRWLWWLFKEKLGGLLADEMGLGKTHQALALLYSCHFYQKLPSLVVCPNSVIDHWLNKIEAYAPNLPVIRYTGTGRVWDTHFHGVLLTTYGILLRDIDKIKTQKFNVILLDEAHLVKSHVSQTYQACRLIHGQSRICLSGTPLENQVTELRTLFDFVLPGYLGTAKDFKNLKDKDLKHLIAPFKLRRIKSDVLTELPDKVEDLRYCSLTPEQQKLYQEALSLKGKPLMDEIVSQKGPIPYIHIFALITLLKQIAIYPGLVDPRYERIPSGKLELLLELIDSSLASGFKIVIFSQYAKMIHILKRILDMRQISHVCLTGETKNRGDVVRSFQENPEIKIFLGSLLAGGVGIDLTTANVVIHYDRWWNAAKEDQATDRVYRIGQKQNVQVYKLITRGTVEERIHELILKKKKIFDNFMNHEKDIYSSFSREEIMDILTYSPETPYESLA